MWVFVEGVSAPWTWRLREAQGSRGMVGLGRSAGEAFGVALVGEDEDACGGFAGVGEEEVAIGVGGLEGGSLGETPSWTVSFSS